MKGKEEAEKLVKECLPLAHDWGAENMRIAIKIAILCVDKQLALLDTVGRYHVAIPYEKTLEIREYLQKMELSYTVPDLIKEEELKPGDKVFFAGKERILDYVDPRFLIWMFVGECIPPTEYHEYDKPVKINN